MICSSINHTYHRALEDFVQFRLGKIKKTGMLRDLFS
jgi:hypothetical protein